MKNCVINFSDGKFIKAQNRLRRSIEQSSFDGDILFWSNQLPPSCPKQEESPWAFKVFAFLEAKKKGYDNVLWIDSSGIVIRSLNKIFKIIEKTGYYLFSEKHSTVGEWSSDIALKNFNITRDESFQIKEIYAYCLGLNFNNKNATKLLNEWHKKAIDGETFRGIENRYSYKKSLTNKNGVISKDSRVQGHRHDQTALSIISNKLGLKANTFFCYDYLTKAKKSEKNVKYIPLNTIILISRDIKRDYFKEKINKYNNNEGINKLNFIFFSLLLTLKLYFKNIIQKINLNEN